MASKNFSQTEISLCATINATIKAKGYTQEHVSKEVGISPASLSNFLNLKIGLSISSIEKVCLFLSIPHISISGVSEENFVATPLSVVEKEHISKVLNHCHWDIDVAHKALGITKYYLFSRIQKYYLKKPSGI